MKPSTSGRQGVSFFMSMLAALGGDFVPVAVVEHRDFSKPLTGRRDPAAHARPLNRGNYVTDAHGSIRHTKPKRPAGMSARGWKKFYKATRRVAKLKAAA